MKTLTNIRVAQSGIMLQYLLRIERCIHIQWFIFCLLCLPDRSMASVFADTTQPVTTVSAVHLSTMISPGRLPMAS